VWTCAWETWFFRVYVCEDAGMYVKWCMSSEACLSSEACMSSDVCQVYVKWCLDGCVMAYSCVRHESCASWLIRVRHDATHSRVCCGLCMRVAWHIHMCVWHAAFPYTWYSSFECAMIYSRRVMTPSRVSWCIHTWVMTHSRMCHDSLYTHVMTPSWVSWRIHTCVKTHSRRVPRLILDACQDSF